jgi:hypothetical protein
MNDFIQLTKKNIIKIGIKDENGNILDGELTFDLEDIDLPLRYQEMLEQHKQNENYLKHQLLIISKQEDLQGKKLLTSNTEKSIRTIKEYFSREIKALDLFLGDGKTEMILNLMNRKPYYTMFKDFSEMLKPIIPVIEKNIDTIDDMIINKYNEKEENVLE